MCPPARPLPPAEIGLHWTDEQIILSLDEYTGGSSLPNNVLADLSPYQYPPSYLPEGIWYLVPSNEKKESVYGFWKAKGEPCVIYSNSSISGLRAKLEYFEGQAPRGQRTDWLMQEYKIMQKELCDENKPKWSRSLCRVFLCSGHSSKNDMQAKDCQTVMESNQINSVASLIPKINFSSPQDFSSESKANRECEVGLFPVTDKQPNSSPPDLSELECLYKGDYLELNDLEDPESHSSSSHNSSCPSKLSDEYFDSLALLRDLEEDENKQIPGKHSTSTYFFTTSNVVVSQPAHLGSLFTSAGSASLVKSSPTSSSSAVHGKFKDKTVQEHTTKRHKMEYRMEDTSNLSDVVAPSNGEKKAGAGRVKKLKMCFCFMPC